MENRELAQGGSGCEHVSTEAKESHEHHHFEKATDVLKYDHRVIEKVLSVLGKLTEGAGEASLERWRKAVDFLRNFADKCHHLKEERIFFPALERRGIPCVGGPIGTMLLEHEEGRGYIRAMAEALSGAGEDAEAIRTELVRNANAYLHLLRQHINKEDEILFPMADEALSLEEQKRLLHKFEEYEVKEIGTGIYEMYIKIARELLEGGTFYAFGSFLK